MQETGAGKRAGLIGVGKMGRALLGLLVRAGHKVRAYDISPEAIEHARANGAEVVASAAEAARGSEFVHIFLTTDEQVESALTGADGVFSTAEPGCLVFVHSTILPETTRRMAAAAPAGVTVTDAAVTSIPKVLAAGEGIFLMGGDAATVARARAYLGPISRNVYHFGPTGAGDAAKIAKNLCNVVERVMVAEAARLAEVAGVDMSLFLQMNEESGTVGLAKWKRSLVFEHGHTEPVRKAGLFSRDIHHAARLAEALGLELRVTKATAETANEWRRKWGDA